MILPLVISPDPRLKICSSAVEKITAETLKLIDDMFETMYHENGVGLSAVQVGVHQRILVMDLQDNDVKDPIVMINPEIINSDSEQSIYNEGCLSFPNQRARVVRPKEVTIRYLDGEGKTQEKHCTDLLATCVQHEIDHLNGVVFIDHISKLKRNMILKKMQKAEKNNG
jgi:peptide deformylase